MKWVRNVVDQSSRLPPFLCSGRNVPSFEAHALSYPGGLRSALLLRMLASDSMSDVEMWRRYFDAVLLADDPSYLPSAVVCSLYPPRPSTDWDR